MRFGLKGPYLVRCARFQNVGHRIYRLDKNIVFKYIILTFVEGICGEVDN